MLTFVKDEGNNLMSIVTTLHSIIDDESTCFSHIMSKIYQYSTNNEKVIAIVKHVGVKIAQGSLQKKNQERGEHMCWQWVMALEIANLGEDWICQ